MASRYKVVIEIDGDYMDRLTVQDGLSRDDMVLKIATDIIDDVSSKEPSPEGLTVTRIEL